MNYEEHLAPFRADIDECITEHLAGAGLMDRRQGDRRALVMAEGHIVECARCSDEFDKTDTTQTDFTPPGSSRADVTWFLCERCMRMLRLWVYEGAFVRVLPERPVTTAPSAPTLDGPGRSGAPCSGCGRATDGRIGETGAPMCPSCKSSGGALGTLDLSDPAGRLSVVAS